jgi:predicted Zn-dependent protease with MMP-like domain
MALFSPFPYVAPMGPEGQRSFAPDAARIEALALETLARMPEPFRAHLGAVVLQVHDWPDDALLDEMGIEDALELTGVYQGRPLSTKSSTDSGALPDMIQLFRLPILFEWAETGVALEELVAHVMVHEIGHHWGLSDADMHALEHAAG